MQNDVAIGGPDTDVFSPDGGGALPSGCRDAKDRQIAGRVGNVQARRKKQPVVVVVVGANACHGRQLENEEILALYQHAKALLFCGIEDFGLVPVEAMATGTPVLALKAGGLLETVEEGKSGFFFETIDELSGIIQDERVRKINPKWCIMRARNFTQQKFKKQIYSYIEKVYEEEKRY